MKTDIRQCRECGEPLAVKSGPGRPRKYCSVACNKLFDNRRMTRGALMYDLVMMWRWDRPAERKHDIRKLMGRVASEYFTEDQRWPTWRDIDDVLQDVTHLRFTAKVQDMTGRRKQK